LIIAVISIVFTSFNNKDKKQFADKITAKAFEVVDENGKVLINLSTYNGNGAITTFDKRGNYLVDIVSNTSGFGNINLYDGKGKATVQLYNVQGGGGAIAIKNKSGVDAMKLHLMTSGSGFISLNTPAGNPLITFGETVERNGDMKMYNANGKIVEQLLLTII
jgi:hypothetical protein